MFKHICIITILSLICLCVIPVNAANWTYNPNMSGYTVDVVNSTYTQGWLYYLVSSNTRGTPGERVSEGGFEGGWGTWTTNGGVVAVREGTATAQPVHAGAWAIRLEPTGYISQTIDLSGVSGITIYVYDDDCDFYINGTYKATLSGSSGVWTLNYIDLKNTSVPYSGVYEITMLKNTAGSTRIDDVSAPASVFGVWEFPIIGFAASVFGPFTDAFSGLGAGNIIYLILWGLFIMMVWRQSGKITIPALIAVISAGAMSLIIPQEAQPWCTILLAAAIASQLFTFFAKE